MSVLGCHSALTEAGTASRLGEGEQQINTYARTVASAANPTASNGSNGSSNASSSSSPTVAESTDGVTQVRVFKTFKWQGQPSEQQILAHAPLVAALEAKNLNPKVPFNVKAVYLQSASLQGKTPIAIRFSKVNGQDLAREHHEDSDNYTWATHTVHPGAVENYTHLNEGKGLKLHENVLDEFAKINSQVSVKDMWNDVKRHEEYMDASGNPTHYYVTANFAGYTDPNNETHEQRVATLSHAAQLVYSNAKHQVNNHPVIREKLPGVQLHPVTDADLKNQAFSGIEVKHDTSGKSQTKFNIYVKAPELVRALAAYEEDVKKSAQPTDARTHTIDVFRPGQDDPKINPKSDNTIGNIAGHGNVTQADVDRAAKTWSTLHTTVLYEIEHPDNQPHA